MFLGVSFVVVCWVGVGVGLGLGGVGVVFVVGLVLGFGEESGDCRCVMDEGSSFCGGVLVGGVDGVWESGLWVCCVVGVEFGVSFGWGSLFGSVGSVEEVNFECFVFGVVVRSCF